MQNFTNGDLGIPMIEKERTPTTIDGDFNGDWMVMLMGLMVIYIMGFTGIYPLVNLTVCELEKYPIYIVLWFTYSKCWCSKVMLVYQRVHPIPTLVYKTQGCLVRKKRWDRYSHHTLGVMFTNQGVIVWGSGVLCSDLFGIYMGFRGFIPGI